MTNLEPTKRKINVRFKTKEDLEKFSDKIGQKLLPNLKEVHYTKYGFELVYKKTVKNLKLSTKEWQENWFDLTPFEINDLGLYAEINFFFDSTNEELCELLEQNISPRTKTVYYPEKIVYSERIKRIIGTRGNPEYPIYIISKGRSKCCVTADHLIKMGVPFRIVIEAQEWNDYSEIYGEERLLELDMRFRDEYDTYIQDFDSSKSKGSGPARNFVWWHSKNVLKSKWHWIMDDNIFGFYYYNDNQRIKAVDGTLFSATEDFINRYDNIGISGLDYTMFCVPGKRDVPYSSNTKIYSCLLINNDVNIRWAGRYNEDVDICIRALKEGYSTIQFDAFLANKLSTQKMGGGNTEAFYAEEGTLPKSNMLAHNHPDITKVQWRFSRWHHVVNYGIFEYYRTRTIGQTIEALMSPQLLDPENEQDKLIIQKIKNIDFSTITKWNIFDGLDSSHYQIIDTLKFYRYKKNSEEILEILTSPKILNCNYYDYIWGNEIPDTEDNRIMLDLLKLGGEESHNGVLKFRVNWNELLWYVPESKISKIVKEMQRNKYLLNPEYQKYEYGLKELILTQEEHEQHRDSKNEILNKLNTCNDSNTLEVVPTYYDLRMRGEVKQKQNKPFKSKLTLRTDDVKKQHDNYTVMVHGSEDFLNEDLFEQEMNRAFQESNQQIQEIINSVNYPVDLMSANLALSKKISNREFVPDPSLYGDKAYRIIYENMAEYANELILFIGNSLSDDLNFLISEFEKNNKKVTIIKNTQDVDLEW